MAVWSAATTTSFMQTFLQASHEPIDSQAHNKLTVEQTHSSADCFHGNTVLLVSCLTSWLCEKTNFWNELRVPAVIQLLSYKKLNIPSLHSEKQSSAEKRKNRNQEKEASTHPSLSSSFFRRLKSRWITSHTCLASSSVRRERSSFRSMRLKVINNWRRSLPDQGLLVVIFTKTEKDEFRESASNIRTLSNKLLNHSAEANVTIV